MKYFLTMICASLLLISCTDDDESDPATHEPAIYPKAERTVIVYMSGENNLSSFVSGDISEMMKGSEQMPANTNLIAFVDKSSLTIPPYIMRISGGKAEIDTYYENETDFYASDPERMYETLHWIMTRYPADTYGLVLWGHASGWIIEQDSLPASPANKPQRAYGVDYGTDHPDDIGHRWMNIPSMARALERLPQRLLFVFADCCNFQNAEVAYELRHATDYVIASPAEIPNVGAPYDKIVPDMFGTSEDFYRQMADDYYAQTTNGGERVPLAVVKTSEMENLARATCELMPNLAPGGEPDTENMIYYRLTRRGGKVKIMFDMNDMMLRNIADGDAYARWKTAYDRAVVYRTLSSRWMTDRLVNFDFDVTEERFGGMSMFVPLSIYDDNGYNFNKTISRMAWYHAAGVDKCYNKSIKK